MEIRDEKDNQITTMEQWEKHFRAKSRDQKNDHWKEGYSAHSLAKFMLDGKGKERLESQLSEILSEEVKLEKGIPEYEVHFDGYKGKGRFHDLGIFGKAGGKKLFVGLEAKVNEPFGASVSAEYEEALKEREEEKPETKKPTRIEELLKLHFPKRDLKSLITDKDIMAVPYQLLHATVGTLISEEAESKINKAELSVFYVLVFQSEEYKKDKGEQNYKAYLNFMEKFGGEKYPKARAKRCIN